LGSPASDLILLHSLRPEKELNRMRRRVGKVKEGQEEHACKKVKMKSTAERIKRKERQEVEFSYQLL
jgi:hypothetical protein